MLVSRNWDDDVPSEKKVFEVSVAPAESLGLHRDFDGVDPGPRKGSRKSELPIGRDVQSEPIGRDRYVLADCF